MKAHVTSCLIASLLVSFARAQDVDGPVSKSPAWLAALRNPSSPLFPRRFGMADQRVESIRGWYLWRAWNPATWEAEVAKESTGETYQVRVLPWATTYRHLVYGARPDDLLPGERVNTFFAADERHPRGYLVHFQDELGQMKGHGHIWEVRSASKEGRFSARVLVGGKPLDEQEPTFELDPKCRFWRDGKEGRVALQAGDRIYLTWCQRDKRRVVFLVSDDASLHAVKKGQHAHVAAEVAREGIAGQIEGTEAASVRFMAFPTSWSQASQIKPGQEVRLTRVGPGYRPTGATVAGKLVSQKNRGSYGSGVNDMVVSLARPEDAGRIAAWSADPVVRLIPMK